MPKPRAKTHKKSNRVAKKSRHTRKHIRAKKNMKQRGGSEEELNRNIENSKEGYGFGDLNCEFYNNKDSTNDNKNEKECLTHPECQWTKTKNTNYCEPNECYKLDESECKTTTVNVDGNTVNKCKYQNGMCIANSLINNPAKNVYNSKKIHFVGYRPVNKHSITNNMMY